MAKRFFHHESDADQRPTVLIVGGNDFIASYLVDLLLLKGCRVMAAAKTKGNFKKSLDKPDFVFFQGDLTKLLMAEKSGQLNQVDYIFYLPSASYSKKLSQPEVTALLDLAQKMGARVLLGQSSAIQSDVLTQVIQQKSEADARLVYWDFVYGPRMDLSRRDELTQLFQAVAAGGPLKIPGGGLKEVYPTFVSDIVYGLFKAMFSGGTSGKTFFLINPQPISLLALAELIQEKSLATLQLEFVNEGVGMPESVLTDKWRQTQSDLDWQAEVGIREGLTQILSLLAPEKKAAAEISQPVESFPTPKPATSQKMAVVASALFLLLVVLFYPFFSLALSSFWGMRSLKKTKAALTTFAFAQAAKEAQVAQRSFHRARLDAQQLAFVFEQVGLEEVDERLEKLATVGDEVAQSVVQVTEAAQKGTELAKIILQNQPGDITYLWSAINLDLETAYESLSLAEAEMKGEGGLLPLEISFAEARHLLLQAKEGLQLLPGVIGVGSKQVYLVLLQNNMELRPTGGFIGSYALITFDDGRLIDWEVQDVYAADGQLKGHVEPPAELKEHLGEAGWYLRDSNWHPDFPTSALRAEWFLKKETGRAVNGVVGINLFLVQHLLEQIGEVEVADFQEKINHHNLFERAEYHSEAGFFPGSTQKKDFLASLTRALLEKIAAGEQETYLSLLKAFYQSLQEKDLLVYLHDPAAMVTLADLGWGGGIRSLGCNLPATQCLVDYLMMVEANVGVNKANYFVKRELDHRVTMAAGGTIEATLKIIYQNQSESEVFPAGEYKNYLRILTPSGTKLKNVFLDGRKLEAEKVDESRIVDKQSFGFLVTVPIQRRREVKLTYQLKEKLDLRQPSQYLLLWQKQPGIKDEQVNFWLTAPAGVALFEAKPKAAQSGQQLVFNPEFNQDLIFEVSLTR